MSFNDNARLDTSQVGSGGGGGWAPGGLVVGGGIGGIILVVVMLLFGINPGSLPGGADTGAATDQSQVQPGGTENADGFAQCRTGADANRDVTCRVVGTVNSVNAFWSSELPRYGRTYRPTKTILYNGTTQSACGTASNQVGPFY